jgi:hypothetical protein
MSVIAFLATFLFFCGAIYFLIVGDEALSLGCSAMVVAQTAHMRLDARD